MMGQFGQVCGMFLTPDKSLTPLQEPLKVMAARMEQIQGSPVQYLYVDNINVVQKDLKACMPATRLKEDPFHAMQRVNRSVNQSQCFDKTYGMPPCASHGALFLQVPA